MWLNEIESTWWLNLKRCDFPLNRWQYSQCSLILLSTWSVLFRFFSRFFRTSASFLKFEWSNIRCMLRNRFGKNQAIVGDHWTKAWPHCLLLVADSCNVFSMTRLQGLSIYMSSLSMSWNERLKVRYNEKNTFLNLRSDEGRGNGWLRLQDCMQTIRKYHRRFPGVVNIGF